MKKLTSILVAAALIAPAAASAGHRINTPGTEARHEANLAPAKESRAAARVSVEREDKAKENRKVRPRAALAGKVNVAARSRN